MNESIDRQAQQRASASTSANARGMKMRIRVTKGDSLHVSNQPKTPPRPQDEPTVRALARLSPALREAFIKAEPGVMAWLRKNQENRTRFLLDPVSALKEAVPDFDERLIGEIQNLRTASGRTTPDVPGFTLDSLELEVAAEEGGKR